MKYILFDVLVRTTRVHCTDVGGRLATRSDRLVACESRDRNYVNGVYRKTRACFDRRDTRRTRARMCVCVCVCLFKILCINRPLKKKHSFGTRRLIARETRSLIVATEPPFYRAFFYHNVHDKARLMRRLIKQ